MARLSYARRPEFTRKTRMKVIASSLRKGNVLDIDGRLYVVLSAENFHPGKGTPVTNVDMRRISDGTKVTERWRTTEQVERAHVEERGFDFLYEDGEGYHFMEPQSYEQVTVHPDVIGDQKVYLQDGMRVHLQTHEGVAIAIELPQKITVEVLETDGTGGSLGFDRPPRPHERKNSVSKAAAVVRRPASRARAAGVCPKRARGPPLDPASRRRCRRDIAAGTQ
jgi:elongation factor P